MRAEEACKDYSYAKAVRPADYMLQHGDHFIEDVLDQGQLRRMNIDMRIVHGRSTWQRRCFAGTKKTSYIVVWTYSLDRKAALFSHLKSRWQDLFGIKLQCQKGMKKMKEA